MTELTITPDYGKKRLKFAGTVAAGEHVAVTVAGAGDWASAEGAVLRLRVLFGNTLVGIVGGDAETENPWQTHSDDPTIAEGAARCELNLNTIPAEKMLKCGGNCFWILDDATNHTLYGAGEWDVRAWPKHRGVDEPIDLDGYPQLVEDMEELKEAWEDYKATVNAALEGKADKATTYTKGETDAAIAAAKNGRFKIVQELPSVAEAESNVIYLVPRTDGETGNVYDEWVVADGAWDKIGTADVDLTDYYNKTETDTLLAGKYEKPNTGIPKTDLSSGVQASLDKADTALQTAPVTDVTVNGTSVMDGTVAKVALGTAASKDVPASGNASASQVVKGDDTRLADARSPTAHASTHAANGSDPITPADIGAVSTTGGTMTGPLNFGDSNNRLYYDPVYGLKVTASDGALGLDGPMFQFLQRSLSSVTVFNSSIPYSANSFVIYGGALYICNTAYRGEWNAFYFTKIIDLETGAPESGGTKLITNGQVHDAIAGATDPVYDNAMAGMFSMDTELQSAASIQDVAIIKLSQLLGEDVSLYEPAQAAA